MSSKRRWNRKKTSTTETGLLSPKLRQHLRKRNTTTSIQLSTPGLKLLAKPGQKLIDTVKLQIRAHNMAARACATNSSTERIKLTPDSSTLSIELINSGITLLKSMLLVNHGQVKSIPRRLIALTKMCPLSGNSRETHELSNILGQNTGGENSSSTSILIDPLSAGSQSVTIGLEIRRVLLELQIISSNSTIISTLSSILGLLRSINAENNLCRQKRSHRSRGHGGQETSPESTSQRRRPRMKKTKSG